MICSFLYLILELRFQSADMSVIVIIVVILFLLK